MGFKTFVPLLNLRTPRCAALNAVAGCVYRAWPNAVTSDGQGNVFRTFAEIPFETAEEIFVYRDEEAMQYWARWGATKLSYNTMFHLIPEEGRRVTAALDYVDENTRPILDEMRRALSGMHWDLLEDC